jgi:HEAT repeat protein
MGFWELIVLGYVEKLVPGLRDPDPWVRVRVAHALKELEDPRATMPLVEALGDPCEEVRGAAAWALQWVGDERALSALVKALRVGDDSVRLWAAAGLERIGDVSCVDALIGALSDSYELVRTYAINALAKIGDRRAVEPLIEALEDEDTHVREAARETLRDTFRIDYNPVTKQTTVIPEEKPVEFESLPVEEQRRIKRQLQVVYNKIKELDQVSSPIRDDKLYDSLYEERGINRRQVTQSIGTLLENGSIITPRSGYYAIAA